MLCVSRWENVFLKCILHCVYYIDYWCSLLNWLVFDCFSLWECSPAWGGSACAAQTQTLMIEAAVPLCSVYYLYFYLPHQVWYTLMLWEYVLDMSESYDECKGEFKVFNEFCKSLLQVTSVCRMCYSYAFHANDGDHAVSGMTRY